MSSFHSQVIVELQSLGVRMPRIAAGRAGGAGPSEGQVLIVDGRYITVPAKSWYVDHSPYSVVPNGKALHLLKHDQPICDIALPQRPQFYDQDTTGGVPGEHVALMHGKECFASTVYQHCLYWNSAQQCAFCGIGLSLAGGATVLKKDPAHLAAAAEQAMRLDGARHVTLTTGAQEDEQQTMQHLARCTSMIRSATALPVHVQVCPPERPDDLVMLKDAGADTIGIHIESINADTLRRIAPQKARYGLDGYRKCWEQAVALFGENQVSSFLIAGLDADLDDVVRGAELLCSLGVFPYVLPLRPVPGTQLESWMPPAAEEMSSVYRQVAALLAKHSLSSTQSKAGCVRCGACSALQFFEKEVPGSCADAA
ncbi:MSMEG_0568 family radical SAM protein [Thermodesulfobacteriota bacterium]